MLEKHVKSRVTALLSLASKHGPLYYWLPVVTAYGKRSLDYICCVQGEFVAIETKATGEWLRPDQRERAREICEAGARVIIISGPDGYAILERYLVGKFPSLEKALQGARKVTWE